MTVGPLIAPAAVSVAGGRRPAPSASQAATHANHRVDRSELLLARGLVTQPAMVVSAQPPPSCRDNDNHLHGGEHGHVKQVCRSASERAKVRQRSRGRA